jgi:hypothetical protein
MVKAARKLIVFSFSARNYVGLGIEQSNAHKFESGLFDGYEMSTALGA